MDELREIDGKFYISHELHKELYGMLLELSNDLYQRDKRNVKEIETLRKENTRLKRLERRQQKRWTAEKERE